MAFNLKSQFVARLEKVADAIPQPFQPFFERTTARNWKRPVR